jgi:hypothetical protein
LSLTSPLPYRRGRTGGSARPCTSCDRGLPPPATHMTRRAAIRPQRTDAVDPRPAGARDRERSWSHCRDRS